MRRPTASQERSILRSVVAKTHADLKTLLLDGKGGWPMVDRLERAMKLLGITDEGETGTRSRRNPS